MPGANNEEVETENLADENEEVLEQDVTDNEDAEEQDEDSKPLTRADLNRFEALLSKQPARRQEPSQSQDLQLTPEQVAAFKDNPALMLNYLNSKVNETKREVTATVNQANWDRKAYDQFPGLNKDAAFQKRVVKQIRELVDDGDFQPNSPKLLYTAAKIAAASYNSKTSAPGQRPNTTALPTKKKVLDAGQNQGKAEFDQKAQFLRMAGYTDDKIKKMVEKYEKSTVSGITPSGRNKRVVKL